MSTVAGPDSALRERILSTLHEVIEELAPLERAPCSPGERQAAEWLAERLRAAGASGVAIEEEPSWGYFQPLGTALGLLGMTGCLLALSGRRPAGAACAAISAAGIVDEAQNGPRVLRRLLRRRASTPNVIASAGDETSTRTLVVLAHHDAAKTGRFFDQGLQRAIHRRWPKLIENGKKQPPQWWLGLMGPALTIMSVMARRRGPALAGTFFAATASAVVADMWRSPTVPGANDNLSAVGALVALAEMLEATPLSGVRVLLVSCGAEETLQDGIRGFMSTHRHELDASSTWFLNLDTVGSPALIMVEGEGPIWMEEYSEPAFRDLVADAAAAVGVGLERGFRARASTDSVIPSRLGYPSAFIGSLTPWRMPANYHLMSDLPENLDYDTVADATVLAHAVAVALARN